MNKSFYEIIIGDDPGKNYKIHFDNIEIALTWAEFYNVNYIIKITGERREKIILSGGGEKCL